MSGDHIPEFVLMSRHRTVAMTNQEPATHHALRTTLSAGRRPWRAKFKDAFRGFKLGIRGQSSFFVHFFFTVVVLAAAIILPCGPVSFGLLLICIGVVLAAELFNSAVETLFKNLDEKTKARAYPSLDIAAAAVLVASIAAALVGGIIFLYKLGEPLGWALPRAPAPGW